MSIINQPEDLLGLALKNLITPLLEDDKVKKRLENWNKVIVVELIDIYGLTFTFNKDCAL